MGVAELLGGNGAARIREPHVNIAFSFHIFTKKKIKIISILYKRKFVCFSTFVYAKN